jgi:hypothetical protein
MQGQISSLVVSIWEVIDTVGRMGAKVNFSVPKYCFGCTILGGKKKDCDLVHLGYFSLRGLGASFSVFA